MTDPVVTLAAAEARALLARERLSHTLGQVQARLDPRARAQEIVREAGDAGQAAIDTVKDKPAILAAVAGLFFARHRIAALFGQPDDTSPDDSGLNPVTRTTS